MLMMMKKAKACRQRSEAKISTNELRLNFDRVLNALKQGRSLTLTYRNKPLARIVPLKEERLLSEDDPIYRLYELAEPIGAPLTNEEMDKLIYGR
jgi:prevent-host-death family protein